MPAATPLATALKSIASSNTTAGDFPPNSSDTPLTFSIAALPIILPVWIEPVNVTLLTSGCEDNAAPVVIPSPVTMFRTPGGSPASVANSANISTDNGVSSDGFNTTVHPAANAGATFHAAIDKGKFHGIIAATTPTGSLLVKAKFCCPPRCCCDISKVSPSILVAHPA